MNTHADRDRSEVPAGPPLHEPTDRDADNVPSDRVRAYAEAIGAKLDSIHYAPRQGCDCAACTDDLSADDLAWHLRDAVMAVADREQATLLARIARIEDGWRRTNAECIAALNRAEEAEDAIARVEAAMKCAAAFCLCGQERASVPTSELRAALRGPEPTEEIS